MRVLGRIAPVAIGLLWATSATAGDKQDFEACDGRMQPGKQADGLRGAASASPYFFGRGNVVEACTRALASPRLLPTQGLRRAHLLRARAAARLEADQPSEALTDLDAADAALAASGGADRFLARSMGVSLMLLRATALAEAGETAKAAALAHSAAAARPYALQVQLVAASIVQASRVPGEGSPSPWRALGRLDPGGGVKALIGEAEMGNFAEVLALRPAAAAEWPATRLMLADLLPQGGGAGSKLLSAMIVDLYTAYARAATRNPAGARRDLALVRERLAAAMPGPQTDPKTGAVVATPLEALPKALTAYADNRARQIEARAAIAEGKPGEALSMLVAAPMPRDALTIDLIASLKTAMPAKDAGMVPDAAAFRTENAANRRKALMAVASDALIAPETPRAVIDYARARPDVLGAMVGAAFSLGTSLLGGVNRTDGFRSTDHPDGTITVEFLGNTPSATIVQEMTLLRAAEIAKARGKSAFVITDRKDFTRRLVQTQYGREVSSTPTGFKSELTIRPVDAGAEPLRAFDAVRVIDDLGPLYYEAAKPGAAAKGA